MLSGSGAWGSPREEAAPPMHPRGAALEPMPAGLRGVRAGGGLTTSRWRS
jgi:hypothetical protein